MAKCPGPYLLPVKVPRHAITVECPLCHRWVRVKRDGTMRAHNTALITRG